MSRPAMIPRNVLNNSRGSRPIYVIVADDFGVQGRLECQLELLDAESVAGHLLMAFSFFPFLAAHRGELFANEMFADLFPSGRGRPSVPTDVMASVITLQALHGLSDSETGPTKWLSQSPPEAKPVIGSYWSNQPGSSQYRIGIKQEPHSAASSYLHICTNIGAGDRESPVEADVFAPLMNRCYCLSGVLGRCRPRNPCVVGPELKRAAWMRSWPGRNLPRGGAQRRIGAHQAAAAGRLPARAHGIRRGRARRSALHHRLREGHGCAPFAGWPREPAHHHGAAGHVRGAVGF
jgi:hypothetical protein